jgi:hypothetical protein
VWHKSPDLHRLVKSENGFGYKCVFNKLEKRRGDCSHGKNELRKVRIRNE